MPAQSTFEGLREFWRAAYAKLDVESGELIILFQTPSKT